MNQHGIVPAAIATRTRGAIGPIAKGLASAGVSANAVTLAGFAVTVAGAFLLARAEPIPAFALLFIGLLCDALDGQVARASGGGTKVGAFLDSTLDRLADAALTIAAVALGVTGGSTVLITAGVAALVASFLVSYVRAKAESLGVPGDAGAAPREARIALILLGVLAWAVTGRGVAFELAIVALAVLASVTFIDRTAHIVNALRKEGS